MNYFDAIFLSIVEGVTEFLPISSTGHLVLASELLKLQQTNFVKSFEIYIQLGAIFAVIFIYFKDLVGKKSLWKPMLVAFLPTAVIGFAMYKVLKSFLLGNSSVTLWALLIGGVAMIVIEYLHKEKESHIDDIGSIPLKTAFGIGLAQSISIIPGVSRAAASILGGMLLGVKRRTATEFSFILAIPTMLGATVLDLVKSDFSFSSYEFSLLGVGFVVSFMVALVSIKFLLGFVRSHTFIPFGIYRIVLAILFCLLIIR